MTLTKLKILAFSDNELRSKVGDYQVQINPEKYSHKFRANLKNSKPMDSAGTVVKFATQAPQDLDFNFTLDATGAVPGVKSVANEIKKLRDVVYDYHGKIHSPYYLKVIWGGLAFRCRLVSMNLDYTLFSPDGKPLRAKVALTFRQHLTPADLELLADKKSADLTHSDVVTAGTTLPLMAYRVYDRSDLYVDVARANDLNDLMHLTEGASLRFPPVSEDNDGR